MVVPVAVDVSWRRVRDKNGVLGLDQGKLVGRRLEHRWVTHDDDLGPDRAVAEKEPGSAATYLLADARVHGGNSGHQWAVHVE